MTLEELTADPGLKAFEFYRTDRGVLYCGDCAAVLADRKGFNSLLTAKVEGYLSREHYWVIEFGCFREKGKGKTYAEAESKARAYLNTLEDKK